MRGAAMLCAALFAATALAQPALAREVPKSADQLLWCGSAYYWLSNNAEEAGNETEADQYAGWSDALMLLVVDDLKAAGFDGPEIAEAIDASDDALQLELGTDKARYDILTCDALVPKS